MENQPDAIIIQKLKKVQETIDLIQSESVRDNGIYGIPGEGYKRWEKLQAEVVVLSLAVREHNVFLRYESEGEEISDPTFEAAALQGYGCEMTSEGFIRAVLPPLLKRREGYASAGKSEWNHLLRAILSPRSFPSTETIFKNAVVIFKHIRTPEAPAQDYDNLEKKCVLDRVKDYYLEDDRMQFIEVYECCSSGETNFLVVYIVPQADFRLFMETYKNQCEYRLNS